MLLPYPMAILRLMLSYGTLPKLPGREKLYPVVVVTIAVDDFPVEISNRLQYQKIRMLLPVVAAADDDVPVERSKSTN